MLSSHRKLHHVDALDARQIERFKTLLEVREHELRLGIEHHKQSARRTEPEPDTVDQAARGYEKESSLQWSNKEQELLQLIETALGRIQDGTFGTCLSCGQEIAKKRLQAVPWTHYCIRCQEDFEQ